LIRDVLSARLIRDVLSARLIRDVRSAHVEEIQQAVEWWQAVGVDIERWRLHFADATYACTADRDQAIGDPLSFAARTGDAQAFQVRAQGAECVGQRV